MATAHIIGFIQSLHTEEIKITKEHIYRANKSISAENKLEKLFEILSASPDKKYTDNELSKLLNCNNGALRVLKSRLFLRVQEALVSNQHFENGHVFNERESILFILKKKVLFVKSLQRKLNQGRVETINTLIQEIIAVAKEFEVYDVLIEILIQKKQFKGNRQGIEYFNAIHKEILFYQDCFISIQKANDAYYHVTLNLEFVNMLTQKEFYNHVKESIKELEIDFKRTNAQEINYYLTILKMVLYENKKDYKNAIFYCKKILSSVQKSKVLYSRDRMGFALANLNQYYVYDGNYNNALTCLKKAHTYHLSNSFNSFMLVEQEFYAHFYNKNFHASEKCISILLKHSLVDKGDFRHAKFIYYKAYTHFALKQFKEAQSLLSKSLEFERDKNGWNISLRILILMIFVELGKTNEVITSLETLRKHIERTTKTKEVKERDILISKLLQELGRDGFKRNDNSKKVMTLIKALADKNKPTAWNYYTSELIPFHEWVMMLLGKD